LIHPVKQARLKINLQRFRITAGAVQKLFAEACLSGGWTEKR
jgi:hypothetical protein